MKALRISKRKPWAVTILWLAAWTVPVLLGGIWSAWRGSMTPLVVAVVVGFQPMLLTGVLPLRSWILYTSQRYWIDDEGVTVEMGLLAKSKEKVPWAKVDLITHQRGVLDGMLGLSQVAISAYGDAGTIATLRGLREGEHVWREACGRMDAHVTSDRWLGND